MTTNEKKHARLHWYPRRFGEPFRIGAKYMCKILEYYEEARCSGETIDFDQYIKATAAHYERARYSVLCSIQRYIKDGWETGCREQWKNLTAWDQENPPNAKQAIRLICESFSAFYERQLENGTA